jgi:hypothetical protein
VVPALSRLSINPFYRLWLDLLSVGGATILATTSFQSADDSDAHVVIADDLATQANTGDSASSEYVSLGSGHSRRLSIQEFHSARCASCFSAAGVQLVRACLLSQSSDEPFSLGDFEFAEVFNSQLWHVLFLNRLGNREWMF